MSNTVYENFVLENKIEDILTTSIDMNAYMTPDYSLTENAGMTKKVHIYTATGNVEDLAMGEGNQDNIEVSFTEQEYKVGVTQGRFVYYDEEVLADPAAIDAGIDGLSKTMTNDLTAKAIAAMGAATLSYNVTDWGFNDFVDAIAVFGTENEEGLFCLINPAQKAAIRKKLGDDLKYVEGFARTGYIGSVCGVPVIVSKAVPANIAYLGTKEAVKCFIKKGVEVEQQRDANYRKNEVYARKVMLIALVDATKMVKMGVAQTTAATITTGTKNTKIISGAATTGATVKAYVNGEYVGSAVADSNAYSITAENNLVAGDKIVVVATLENYLDSKSAEFTVAA